MLQVIKINKKFILFLTTLKQAAFQFDVLETTELDNRKTEHLTQSRDQKDTENNVRESASLASINFWIRFVQ